MSKPPCIELPGAEPIRILYEDRSVLALDKPRGWMLVPFSWQRTSRNLQTAITSSIQARDFWARSRNIRFLRFVHRLDAETTGVLLFAKSAGAVKTYGELFEGRKMEKLYLAVVHGTPKEKEWTCRLRLGPNPRQHGRMKVDARHGKVAETQFRVLSSGRSNTGAPPHPALSPNGGEGARRAGEGESGTRRTLARPPTGLGMVSLLEARPFTGRTHQIRVHLAQSGFPVVGDELYGRSDEQSDLALRAVRLSYVDPFTRRQVEIRAPAEKFAREYGFDILKL